MGLISETATIDDVLFGFYQFLTDHPSEAFFLSFQYEGSTTSTASFNADTQLALFNSLTNPAARHYFLQTTGVLGTLGQARGKITLLKRFDLDMLPESYTAALPGLHLSPNAWTDNGADITLVYNASTNGTAYIEDLYSPSPPDSANPATNIQWKLNATEAHLQKATLPQYKDDLFWTFASGGNTNTRPVDTPKIYAVGNGTKITPEGGVNQHLDVFLRDFTGKRVGWVMFDFFETPSGLVDLLLSL